MRQSRSERAGVEPLQSGAHGVSRPTTELWSNDGIGARVSVRSKLFSFLSLTLLLLATGTRAASPATAFDAANKLYEQGSYADAAHAYEQLIQSGAVSPTLYFNLGNALFKSRQIGRAIVAYRRTAELTPRDPDVRANLQFARNQVQGPTLHPGRWERWLGTLRLNEWTTLAAGAVWLTFLMLAAMQLRPGLGRTLRSPAAGCAGAAVVLCGCLGLALVNQTMVKTAVIVAHDATVRNGPLEEAPSAFVAQDGAELRVLDQKDDWLQVTDGTRRIGWVQRDRVLVLPTKA